MSRGRRRRSCDPVVKLGEVRNGDDAARTRCRSIASSILITAEASPRRRERAGRLVLRGTSASVRMQPHDLAFLLAGLLEQAGAPAAADARTHAARATPTPAPGRVDAAADASGGVDAAGVDDAAAGRVVVPAGGRRRDSAGAAARAAAARRRRRARRSTAAPVRRVLFGRTVTMLGFNGQYPGPLIQVDEALDDRRALRQPHRLPDRRALARRAARQSLRRRAARDAGSGAAGRLVRVPRALSATPASTGITRIIARTCCRTSASTAICWCARASPTSSRPANREEVLMLDDLLVAETGPGRATASSRRRTR